MDHSIAFIEVLWLSSPKKSSKDVLDYFYPCGYFAFIDFHFKANLS